MANPKQTPELERDRPTELLTRTAVDRRSFLRYTGATAVVGGLVLAGCKKDDPQPPTPTPVVLTTKLTNDDTGYLNYAYALEQLEAAFYTKVVADHRSLFTAAEVDILSAIRDHEIIHREFFKKVLGDKRLADLTVDYTAGGNAALAIDLTSKAAILAAARKFEDVGVIAYNGAGKYLQNVDYLLVAGKIVSVEARHAALIRNLIQPNSFASDTAIGSGLSLVPAALVNGLDQSMKPSQILPLVLPYITQRAALTTDPNFGI